MEYITYFITWVIIIVAVAICYKISGKNNTQDILNKTNLIMQYAGAFVSWAKQFQSSLSGNEKMNMVVEKLIEVADKNDIDISELEIKAIAQQAYDFMKNRDEIVKQNKTTTVQLMNADTSGIIEATIEHPCEPFDDTLKQFK